MAIHPIEFRYGTPEMKKIWEEENKLQRMLDVESALAQAEGKLGIIPQEVADEIAALKPETIIISSPHSIMYSDYFHISPGSGAHGSFADFGAPEVKFDVDYDEELVKAICARAEEAGWTGALAH